MKLEVQDLCKHYDQHIIFDHISFSLSTNSLAIVGPSGSGKTSLLKLFAGLEAPQSGVVHLNEKQIPFTSTKELLQYRRNIGVVFQSWNLFPHLSALENIMLPLIHVHGYTVESAKDQAYALLQRFSLIEHVHKKPSQLSGGQNQRVAILRAIAFKPALLLFDEPTSALDPLMTVEVLDLIFELKTEGASFILISHHLSFVKKISDFVLFISEGKPLEIAPTTTFFDSPKHPIAKEYLSRILKYEQR